MQRLTISLDDKLADALDQMIRAQGYGNRSEALRDIPGHDGDARAWLIRRVQYSSSRGLLIEDGEERGVDARHGEAPDVAQEYITHSEAMMVS